MKHTHTHSEHSFGEILRRTSMQFFLFSAVLAGLLLLSWYLLIPELTHIEVGGSVRGLRELKEYKANLEAQILTIEHRRNAFLAPVQSNAYSRIKQLKKSRLKYQEIRTQLTDTATTLIPDTKNAVAFSRFRYDSLRNIVELQGEVRNVGPRSMTVLAQFVEAVEALPTVIAVQSTRYTRKEDPEIGYYSPFTLLLQLR